MKKVLSFLVVVVMLTQSVSLTQLVNANAAKKPKLNKTSITLEVGNSQTLKVTGTKKKVKWKSAKKSIASVSNKGKVTAKKVGMTTITAAVGKKTLKCKVTVVDASTTKAADSTENNTATESSTTEEPMDVSKFNKKDVEALKAIIKDQRSRGAIVSEDLTSEQYKWTNGELHMITWENCKLSGELSTAGLDNLNSLFVGSWYYRDGDYEANIEWKDYANSLSEIDVSRNSELISLDCHRCGLASIDVSKNVELGYLYCFDNCIKELNVSKNVNLVQLDCGNNQLIKLDVSKNIILEELSCYRNQLKELDISKNVGLLRLECFDNQLTKLDVSKNTKLEDLECGCNQLRLLDVSKNTVLKNLSCDSDVEVIGYKGE